MSKIEDYKQKQLELDALKQVTGLSLVQIEYTEGGLQNLFQVPEASPLALSSMLSYIRKHGIDLLGAMLSEAEAEVETARREAKDEATLLANTL